MPRIHGNGSVYPWQFLLRQMENKRQEFYAIPLAFLYPAFSFFYYLGYNPVKAPVSSIQKILISHYEKAKDLLEKALESDLKNFGEQHPTVAIYRSNLATVYSDLGGYEKARDLLETALQNSLKNFGEQHPTVAIDLNNQAWVYFKMKDFVKAKGHFEKAIAILLKTVGPDHPNTKTVLESFEFVKTKMAE
jgi:tetratricopeptide (TPR) repeat protein